ncbi:hypothetical protein [Desertibaculum subflavum]|uniref:hypothetical protein n=1 Tax=Desertibaculum subflavum TaxID=2268458 RepID=UPI0013C51CCB
MVEKRVSLEQARAAKSKAKRQLGPAFQVVGVGLTKVSGCPAVKVNLAAPPIGTAMPKQIDGVPLVFEVVGRIRRLASG